MTRRELEEINDQLQVQIAQLQEQLRSMPTAEKLAEYESLQRQLLLTNQKLEESETQRRNLAELVTHYQKNRENELLELEADRKRVAELREMDLRRIGAQASELAAEREVIATERLQMFDRIEAAEKAQKSALRTEEGWKRQATFAAEKLREAESREAESLIKITDLKAGLSRGEAQMLQLQRAPSRPAWIEAIEMFSENSGCFIMILLAGILVILLGYVVNWIWHLMWS